MKQKITWKKYTEIEFRKAISESTSWSEVARKLNVSKSGSRSKLFKKLCNILDIETSHFLGLAWSKGKKIDINKKWGIKAKPEEVLVENSPYKGGSNGIKKILIKHLLLKYQCYNCTNNGNWMKKNLVLQLDHINGNNKDNRIENLRFLCPNCHSQTSTFGSKKRDT